MKAILVSIFLIISSISFSQKQIYIPTFITNTGMNLNDPASQWCYARSTETENWIIFWEAGFGNDPSKATGNYTVNMEALKICAEKSFLHFRDSLRMVVKGSSVTDTYKQMIFILYSTEWAAYGSGQDNKVGTLHVNPAAANIAVVLAHEIGHCFQYLTGCDSPLGGYRYGFGPNASGGNGFWEQCAQWKAFKAYPNEQFKAHDFTQYIQYNHLNILHETPRYANYFLPDFWTFKQNQYFIGRLWRDSRKPEDPVETYKRLTAINQEQFNDQMYEHAARLTTWDIPSIREYGANYIFSRKQVQMTQSANNYWTIDSVVCIENYGYNSIQLNVPTSETTVNVTFKGLAGTAGFRSLNVTKAGWRFGFVALLNDGTRVYSDMATAKYTNGMNPTTTLSFRCPNNCKALWLVVSGAPQEHWRHAWDDDNSNNEQWPYQVQFTETNLFGFYTNPIHNESLAYTLYMQPMTDYTPTPVTLDRNKICHAFAMPPDSIAKLLGIAIRYYGVNPDGTLNANSTATAPGHWYNKSGQTVAWGTNSFVFSELSLQNLIAKIGQYPNKLVVGDVITIRQALIYTKSANETARIDLSFTIIISPPPITQTIQLQKGWNLISLFVRPVDSTITSIFAGKDVQEIKTASAFWYKGQNLAFNSLNTMSAGQGYLVKMNAATSISITGVPLSGPAQYPVNTLKAGWNLLGCPYQNTTPFTNHFNATNCQIIKNFDGFWQPGGTTNSITNFEPGKAYYIKL